MIERMWNMRGQSQVRMPAQLSKMDLKVNGC